MTDTWYCVESTSKCDCGKIHRHIHNNHRIVVWPTNHDRSLIAVATEYDGRIIPYKYKFGECVSFYMVSLENGV